MIIRFRDGTKWKKFTERETLLIGYQNAYLAMLMLSSFAPVVIELEGRYIAHKNMYKELDGPCASFETVLKKIPRDKQLREVM